MIYNCEVCNIEYSSNRKSKYCKVCREIKKKETRKRYKKKVALENKRKRKKTERVHSQKSIKKLLENNSTNIIPIHKDGKHTYTTKELLCLKKS